MIGMDTALKFRKMELDDIPSVLEIEEQSFTIPWKRSAFVHELTQNHFAHYVLAVVGEDIVGYCGMWTIIDEAHITNIAVLPKYRGHNFGESLLRHMMLIAVLNGAARMTLEVRVSNIPAQRLYRKLGFKENGRRPRYYTDNHEDALIMWVNLDE